MRLMAQKDQADCQDHGVNRHSDGKITTGRVEMNDRSIEGHKVDPDFSWAYSQKNRFQIRWWPRSSKTNLPYSHWLLLELQKTTIPDLDRWGQSLHTL